MPEIIYNADQGAGVRKIIRIMQGDTRSHVIRFVVPRYESGVDLSPLVWYIKFVDAEGKPDIAIPSALYEVTADEVRVRWQVNGVPTDKVGSTRFQLFGVGRDHEGKPISWASGVGEIEVTENLGFEVSEDQERELSALDELILYSKQELNSLSNKANAIVATAEGTTVEIYADEGSILKPVIEYGPVMAGSGDPSPTNIRAISARTGGTLTCNGSDYVLSFGQEAYAGTVDWNAKTMTINGALITLDGSEVDSSNPTSGGTADVVVWLVGKYQGTMLRGDSLYGWCSHFVNGGSTKNINTIRFGANTQTIYFYLSSADFADAAAFKAYVVDQAAKGTPVQIVYPLNETVTVPLDVQMLTAIDGLNTLHTDAEQMTVTYNKAITAALEESGGSGGGSAGGETICFFAQQEDYSDIRCNMSAEEVFDAICSPAMAAMMTGDISALRDVPDAVFMDGMYVCRLSGVWFAEAAAPATAAVDSPTPYITFTFAAAHDHRYVTMYIDGNIDVEYEEI